LLRRLINEHLSEQADHSDTLWALLVLEKWFRGIDNPPDPMIPGGWIAADATSIGP
jgi:hypothetical protein